MSDATTVPALLTDPQVTELLGLPVGALRQDRYLSVGLPYVRIGHRIRYRAEDVAAYIAANTVTPEPAT
jgi:hypothetical protein